MTGRIASLMMVALFCTAIAGASAAPPDTFPLYSNLGPNNQWDHLYPFEVSGSDYLNQVMAISFSTSQRANIADAVLAMSHFQGSNAPVNVYLESDNNDLPGTILDTLTQMGTIQPYSGGGGLVTFACGSCPVVNAYTQYWIVAQEPTPDSDQYWMYTSPHMAGSRASNRLGSATGPWEYAYGSIAAFEVDGYATPEPGTFVMLGSGILGLAGISRRKFLL